MGWWNPLHKELGVSLQNITISQPYYEPIMDDEEPEEPSDEPQDTGDFEDTGVEKPEPEVEQDEAEELVLDETVPVKSCSSSTTLPEWILLLSPLAFIRRRR